MFDWLVNKLGWVVGKLEVLGLKYPVRHYISYVDDHLARGSRLDAEMGHHLQVNGVRTIVNLCAEDCADAEFLDPLLFTPTLIRIPVLDNTWPTMAQIYQFLNLFSDDAHPPVYIHCEAGVGRTGVFVACYRIAICKWNVEQVIEEAQKFGLKMPDQIVFIREFWQRGGAFYPKEIIGAF